MPDYRAAAMRHFLDGDLLSAQNRPANACQLWAYGAECALKAILLRQNFLQLDANGKPTGMYRKHINDPGNPLLGAYLAALGGHVDYALPARSSWFAGWTIDQRYEDGTSVATAHTIHRNDKAVFQHLLLKAVQNGDA